MIHHLPAAGALNHGLVNYNPKFFWYLARSNGYKWLYMDYHGGAEPYALPQNILETVSLYEPDAARFMGGRITVDYAIQVALQKTLDIPFVPPLDIEEDAATVETPMKERYWTVFEPRTLEAVRRGGGAQALVAHELGDQAMENKEAAATGRPIFGPDRGKKDTSDEIRAALNLKISSASHEIRAAMARAFADSEESIRTAVDRKVSDSEEAIRDAFNRAISDSEEAVRTAIDRKVSESEEAIRQAFNRAVLDSEQKVHNAIGHSEQAIRIAVTLASAELREAMSLASAELRGAMVRIPGRRFVSLIGAVSAVIAAILVAMMFAVSHLLHF
jgi:hypothetical protein